MNMQFWRRWIFLWALMPVFSAFFLMASHRFFHDTVAIQAHHQWGIRIVFFMSGVLYLTAPYLVLRQHIRGYRAISHCAAIVTCLIGWCFVQWLTSNNGIAEIFFKFQKDFSLSVLRAKFDAPVLLVDVFDLPWWKLLSHNILTMTIVIAGPIFIVCRAAKRVGNFPKVMLFVLLAFAAITISEALYEIFISRHYELKTLNSRTWYERFAIITSWSASSAIGASISAIGISSLLEPINGDKRIEQSYPRQLITSGFRLATVTIVVLWSAILGFHYLSGPNGISSNFVELRKTLTSAPETDISIGKDILKFSHVLNVKTYRYRTTNYVNFQLSPDNKSAVLLEAYGKNGKQLAAFDTTTGNKIAALGDPLTQHERVSFIWTKDQKHLLVRSRGKPIKTSRYTRHETKITLFSLPNYHKIAEWQSTETSCQNPTFGKLSMLEDDSRNLFVLCSFSTVIEANPPLAIQLLLPLLDEVDVRTYERREKGRRANRFIKLAGSVYAPLMQRKGNFAPILGNIANPERSITLDNPKRADRGGKLTFQGFVTDDLTDDTIGMRYCGGTNKVSNPPQDSTKAAWGASFCRILRFGVSNGSYIGFADSLETRVRQSSSQPREFSISFKPWQFTGEIDPASKIGKFRVSEIHGGAIIQTLESNPQVPVIASSELGVLFTHRIDTRQIAVYRIAQ